MEEEKKELETTNTEVSTPEEAPAVETPAVQEEPVEEKIESLDEPEKIESLDDEPIESLDEPETLGSDEVIIEGVEEQTEEAPEASEEVPVVPKATENPVLEHPEEAPEKKEEIKPETVKEEPKKEKEKDPNKKSFFEENSSLVKIIIVGVVLLVIGIGVNIALGTFSNPNPVDEEEYEPTPKPVNTSFDISKAGDVVKAFELSDSCGSSFVTNLNKSDFSTSTINDLDKKTITSLILSKFDNSKEKITNEEFQAKAKELFVLTGDFVPAESGNLISDGTCTTYNFDSSTNEFTKDAENTCDAACGPDAKYSVMAKALSGTNNDGTITIEYKVLYGNVDEEGLKVYSDAEHTSLVNTYSRGEDGSYGTVSDADYSNGAGFKFVFKQSGDKYLFVKSEIVR